MRHLSAKSVWPFGVLTLLTSAALACAGGAAPATLAAQAITPAGPAVTLAPATSPTQAPVTLEPAPIASPTTPPAALAVFKTPEDAIAAYLEGVAQGNLQKISQACAIDEMSEKFDFAFYTNRLGGAFQPVTFLAPANYPFYVETNKLQLSSLIFSRVKILAYSLLSSEKVDDGSLITGMDAARIDSFLKDVDPKRLSGLAVVKTGLPNKTIMSSANYLDNAAKQARIYGADESTERVVLLSFEQNDYMVGFTLLRYGDNWKISNPTSPLAGTSVAGAATKTTADAFDNLIGGN